LLLLSANVNVAGTAGSGVLAQGGKMLLVGGSEIILAASMLTVDSYRAELNQTETGRQVLEVYDGVMVLFIAYQGAKAVVGLPEAFTKLKTTWNSFKQGNKILDAKAVSAIDNEIGEVERRVAQYEIDGVESIVKNVKLTFKVGDEIAGIKIARIKEGTNGKVFVFGTDMENRIEPFAKALEKQGYKVELFNAKYQTKSFVIEGESYIWEEIMEDLAHGKYKRDPITNYVIGEEIPNTLMFKANKQFAEKLIRENYTVISIDLSSKSPWFNMEFNTIFK
jgi:hypothetical protein